jgi:hypothetical protein
VLVDELVDSRLIGGIDLLELQPHSNAPVAPRDSRFRFDIPFRTGQPEPDPRLEFSGNGLIVRIASPPLLRFSVSAAEMVLPKR